MGLRLGSALILIGLIVLTVYLLSFDIDQANPWLLLGGLLLSLVGLLLRRRSAARSKRQANRFYTLRRLLGYPVEQDPE